MLYDLNTRELKHHCCQRLTNYDSYQAFLVREHGVYVTEEKTILLCSFCFNTCRIGPMFMDFAEISTILKQYLFHVFWFLAVKKNQIDIIEKLTDAPEH